MNYQEKRYQRYIELINELGTELTTQGFLYTFENCELCFRLSQYYGYDIIFLNLLKVDKDKVKKLAKENKILYKSSKNKLQLIGLEVYNVSDLQRFLKEVISYIEYRKSLRPLMNSNLVINIRVIKQEVWHMRLFALITLLLITLSAIVLQSPGYSFNLLLFTGSLVLSVLISIYLVKRYKVGFSLFFSHLNGAIPLVSLYCLIFSVALFFVVYNFEYLLKFFVGTS